MRLRKVLFGSVYVASFILSLQGIAFFARSAFSLVGICNEAGPFGWPLPFSLLTVGFLMASSFFLVCWWQETDMMSSFFWLLLLAAGGGNFVERLSFGCIFDYLSFGPFPSFNVADVLLTVSVVFLGWRGIRKI